MHASSLVLHRKGCQMETKGHENTFNRVYSRIESSLMFLYWQGNRLKNRFASNPFSQNYNFKAIMYRSAYSSKQRQTRADI